MTSMKLGRAVVRGAIASALAVSMMGSTVLAAGVDLSQWSPEYVRSIAGTETYDTVAGCNAVTPTDYKGRLTFWTVAAATGASTQTPFWLTWRLAATRRASARRSWSRIETVSLIRSLGELGCEYALSGERRMKLIMQETVEISDLYRLALAHEVQIRRLNFKRDSLEDIFLKAMENGNASDAATSAANNGNGRADNGSL